MTGVNVSFTDADREQISQCMWEVGDFEKGDRVTVEPAEHDIAYAGQELEGVPLIVSDVWVSDVQPVAPGSRADPEHSRYSDEHYVTLEGDYEHYAFDQVLVTKAMYTFEGDVRHHMSNDSLISWVEYRRDHEKVFLLEDDRETTRWIEPADEPCEVCGCNRVEKWYKENRHAGFMGGGESCPACGNVIEMAHP